MSEQTTIFGDAVPHPPPDAEHEPTPREQFLTGIFASWGYAKPKAAAAARAAMEELS